MAVDEALARELEANTGVLRFYEWREPTISFGRNQPADGRYDLQQAAALGVDFVRRPTGGRAVLHDRELTYTVVVADHTFGGPRGIYTRVQAALAQGLAALGVAAVRQASESNRPAARPSTHPCFGEALPGEVTISGQKVVGSAQARIAGVVLQHGSILLRNGQRQLDVLTLDKAENRGSGALSVPTTLEEAGVLVSPADAARHLELAFTESVSGSSETSSMNDSERAVAEGLLVRFESREWTWRR